VPSEFSPADRGDRDDRLYDVEAMVVNIGEDPARWLDRNLEHHGFACLEQREFSAWDEDDWRLVPDEQVSKPLEMVKGRIDGIDEVAVARAWQAVERRLRSTPEGGRDIVIEALEERIAELEENGDRDLPGLSPEQQRERAVEAYEAADKGDAVILDADGEQTARSQGKTAEQKLAAMADGGEDE